MSTTMASRPTASAAAASSPDWGWNPSVAEWLAGIFMAPPTADVITRYRAGFGATYLAELASEPACWAGVQRMRSAMTVHTPPGEAARALAVAFTHLFDGVDGPRTVPLYESAYVSTSGRLFQEPAGEIGRLLHQWDLSTPDWFKEPPDHVAIELALLAHLMRRADSAPARDAEATLLNQHLLAWVPLLAARCEALDETGFYAGATSVLDGFLSARRAALQRSCPANAALAAPVHPVMGDNLSRDRFARQERE